MWEIADAVEFITAVLRGFQPDIKKGLSVLPSGALCSGVSIKVNSSRLRHLLALLVTAEDIV